MNLFLSLFLLSSSIFLGYCLRLPTQCKKFNDEIEKSKKRIAIASTSLLIALANNFSPSLASDSISLLSSENQLINIFEENTPSTVYINTFVERIDAFSMNVIELPAGTGTGFVWDDVGHIVTNYHVIRDAKSAQVIVTGPDGKRYTFEAQVAGVDPDKDVAVLYVDNNKKMKWRPIKLGESANLKVGQFVLAIGNPFGLDHSLSTGVVSGLSREVRSPSNKPISNVIQTDAAINPGNSGGPLLNSAGKLIGMNTAIFTKSGASAGIGFAIPADTLRYEVDTLIKEGKIVRPVIGVSYLGSSQAKLVGINQGILVLNAPPQSGIQGTTRNKDGSIVLGDIIIGIDDDTINTEADLFKAVEKHKVGDVVTIKLLRQSPKGDIRNQDGVLVEDTAQSSPVNVKLRLSSPES